MSKRYIITRKNGSLEDWGADSLDFKPSHILFMENGKMTHAVHVDEVREIAVEEEG